MNTRKPFRPALPLEATVDWFGTRLFAMQAEKPGNAAGPHFEFSMLRVA